MIIKNGRVRWGDCVFKLADVRNIRPSQKLVPDAFGFDVTFYCGDTFVLSDASYNQEQFRALQDAFLEQDNNTAKEGEE